MSTTPVGDTQRVEQAADEIAERFRQLGWLEELAKMKSEDSVALHAMDGSDWTSCSFAGQRPTHGGRLLRDDRQIGPRG